MNDFISSKNRYVRVGGVPVTVEYTIQFGVPLLVCIRRLDGTDITHIFSPEHLELIFTTAISNDVKS
jgi:hypothetical protein